MSLGPATRCVRFWSIVLFMFMFLQMVYQPKVKYHVGDKQPPQISSGYFSWIPPLIHSKEPYLLDKIGLDAVVFLRFLRLLRWLFLFIAVLTCAVLIPVNVSYNIAHVPSGSRDILSMLTIRDVKGHSLFVHIAAEYVISQSFLGYPFLYMLRQGCSWFGHVFRVY